MEKIIKKIAKELQKEENKNHVFKEKLIGNVVEVPVIKNCDNIMVASPEHGAFSLMEPLTISFKKVESKQYLVRIVLLRSELNKGNAKDIMSELAVSLKRNIGLRDNVITYGPLGRLSFRLPGRGPDKFILEHSDGIHCELRAYADIAFSESYR